MNPIAEGMEFLEGPPTVRESIRVLVVTKMWPSHADRLQNGFVKLQVAALRDAGVGCDVLVTQGLHGVWSYWQTMRAVQRLVATRPYDVVHAHYGVTGLAASFQTRGPLVVTFHGSDLIGVVDRNGRKTMKGRVEPLLSRAAAHRARMAIVVSGQLLTAVPTERRMFIPIGIDEHVFRPMDRADARRRLGLHHERRYVLFAANPARAVKRAWLADAAVERVRETFADTELLLVHGRDVREMPIWMNAADVLIITSAYEGGPLIHREAMACNLPVVSVDVGEVRSRLAAVKHCYVADADDVSLGHALCRVLADRPRSDGREQLDGLTNNAVANQLVELYRRMAGRAEGDEVRNFGPEQTEPPESLRLSSTVGARS
jgi:glycosyltransferase involved in cell wall biosynthesis